MIRRELAAPPETVMVFINFSSSARDVWVQFPKAGAYVEQIDKNEPNPRPTVQVASDDQWCKATVRSYYGCVFRRS